MIFVKVSVGFAATFSGEVSTLSPTITPSAPPTTAPAKTPGGPATLPTIPPSIVVIAGDNLYFSAFRIEYPIFGPLLSFEVLSLSLLVNRSAVIMIRPIWPPNLILDIEACHNSSNQSSQIGGSVLPSPLAVI